MQNKSPVDERAGGQFLEHWLRGIEEALGHLQVDLALHLGLPKFAEYNSLIDQSLADPLL